MDISPDELFDCKRLQNGDRITLRGNTQDGPTDVVGVVAGVHDAEVIVVFPSSEGWGDTSVVSLLGAFKDPASTEGDYTPRYLPMKLRAGVMLNLYTVSRGTLYYEFSSVTVTRGHDELHHTHTEAANTPRVGQNNP